MNIVDKFHKYCPCRKKTPTTNRTVFVGNRIPEGYDANVVEDYLSNYIVSSKYTAWNFIPKNLFEQIQRIANLYFLIVAIIEVFVHTSVSPWTSILPLIFVVVITAIKQGYEDWLRHKADREVNYRDSLVLQNRKLRSIKAKDIRVGDVVKVSSNSEMPCDMVILSSSEDDGNCYITTSNLDGETNLKTCNSLTETRHLQSEFEFESFIGHIECQQPNADLYRFNGRIHIHDFQGGINTQPVGAENVLLRGSRLKNTAFIYGCAIYTGQETKISMNSRFKSHKYSRVERKMNVYLIFYLVILISYSIIWVIISLCFYSTPKASPANMWYVGGLRDFWSSSSWDQFVIIIEEFLSYMILCNYIIPISMYVTVELQKFLGSVFFEWDIEMFDEISNEAAKALTSDLNEELGQVEYLFTDKTGTLTENEMEFRQCSVGGIVYEDVNDQLCVKPSIPGIIQTPLVSLTPDLERLFTIIALCHAVRLDRLPCQDEERNLTTTANNHEYQSSSPDEKALVEASAKFGIIYHGKRDNMMLLNVTGRVKRFKLHHTLDFDSIRKRMSVIVENEEDHNRIKRIEILIKNGKILLLCKGAETAVFERVSEGDVEAVERHVNDFAVLGLRTLVIADRQLSRAEFVEYDAILTNAKQSIDDREEKLAEAFDAVETKLRLIGTTAIEDKLQDGVPETISALREAGIQVWVLTGDKEETAVNISYSTGHFDHTMLPLSLTKQTTSEECLSTLENCIKLVNVQETTRKHALIIDGKSLSLSLEDNSDLLRVLCEECAAVLCCRMSPIQKASVVKLMKSSSRKPTTAAIGDGANDVSMIQEADVGLGIIGKEGRQAVRSSDYAFGRFRFLQRAFLVHGQYFYMRIAILVQYFFYKNVAMITAQLYFTFFSAYSAQSLFNGYYLMFFNITFTALPILLYSLFEKHIPASRLYLQPKLYRDIGRNRMMSNWNFLKWNIIGLWHSVVLFFGTYFALAPGNSPFENGQEIGMFDMGTVIMTTCVICVNVKLILETHHFNGIVIGGFIVSIGSYFLMTTIQCIILWPVLPETVTMYGAMQIMLSSGSVWLLIMLLTVTALLPDILIRAISDNFTLLHHAVSMPFSGSTSDLLSSSGDIAVSQTIAITDLQETAHLRKHTSDKWSIFGDYALVTKQDANNSSFPNPSFALHREMLSTGANQPMRGVPMSDEVDLSSIEMHQSAFSNYVHDNPVFNTDV